MDDLVDEYFVVPNLFCHAAFVRGLSSKEVIRNQTFQFTTLLLRARLQWMLLIGAQ